VFVDIGDGGQVGRGGRPDVESLHAVEIILLHAKEKPRP
jgi:hypothetical protein